MSQKDFWEHTILTFVIVKILYKAISIDTLSSVIFDLSVSKPEIALDWE